MNTGDDIKGRIINNQTYDTKYFLYEDTFCVVSNI